MRGKVRRALIALAVLGLGAFGIFVTDLPAHAGVTKISFTDHLYGVAPSDSQTGVTPPGYPQRDGVAYTVTTSLDWAECMDADDDTIRQNGGKAQIFRCNGQVFQQWFFDSTGVDGLFQIRTVYRPDGCLDADSSVGVGSRVQIWTCLGPSHHNQLWWLISKGQGLNLLKSDWNGQCVQIDDAGFHSGSWLHLADCTMDSWQQRWWPHDRPLDAPPQVCPPVCRD
jgi:hypothetical protein